MATALAPLTTARDRLRAFLASDVGVLLIILALAATGITGLFVIH